MPRPARLLCVGKEPELLRARCAVVGSASYNARSAVLPEAKTLLRTEEIDPVVVSARVKRLGDGQHTLGGRQNPHLRAD
jgi:hypothetical protein